MELEVGEFEGEAELLGAYAFRHGLDEEIQVRDEGVVVCLGVDRGKVASKPGFRSHYVCDSRFEDDIIVTQRVVLAILVKEAGWSGQASVLPSRFFLPVFEESPYSEEDHYEYYDSIDDQNQGRRQERHISGGAGRARGADATLGRFLEAY